MNKLNIKDFVKSFSRVGGIGALLILIMVIAAFVNLKTDRSIIQGSLNLVLSLF